MGKTFTRKHCVATIIPGVNVVFLFILIYYWQKKCFNRNIGWMLLSSWIVIILAYVIPRIVITSLVHDPTVLEVTFFLNAVFAFCGLDLNLMRIIKKEVECQPNSVNTDEQPKQK